MFDVKKNEFDKRIVRETGIRYKDVRKVTSAVPVVLRELFEEGFTELYWPSLGRFKTLPVKEHERLNLQTGEKFIVPEHNIVHFTMCRPLKNCLRTDGAYEKNDQEVDE